MLKGHKQLDKWVPERQGEGLNTRWRTDNRWVKRVSESKGSDSCRFSKCWFILPAPTPGQLQEHLLQSANTSSEKHTDWRPWLANPSPVRLQSWRTSFVLLLSQGGKGFPLLFFIMQEENGAYAGLTCHLGCPTSSGGATKLLRAIQPSLSEQRMVQPILHEAQTLEVCFPMAGASWADKVSLDLER